MKKKGKTITFRRYKYVDCEHGFFSLEELKAKLIEDCFNAGYVPFEPKYEYIPEWDVDRVYTNCAYAGKRAARKLGVQKWPATSFLAV